MRKTPPFAHIKAREFLGNRIGQSQHQHAFPNANPCTSSSLIMEEEISQFQRMVVLDEPPPPLVRPPHLKHVGVDMDFRTVSLRPGLYRCVAQSAVEDNMIYVIFGPGYLIAIDKTSTLQPQVRARHDVFAKSTSIHCELDPDSGRMRVVVLGARPLSKEEELKSHSDLKNMYMWHSLCAIAFDPETKDIVELDLGSLRDVHFPMKNPHHQTCVSFFQI